MKIIPVKFLSRIHVCNNDMTRIQARVLNLETNKELWLLFTKNSKMFPRAWNTGRGYIPEFYELIKYDEIQKNRVTVVKDEDIRLKYSMYLI